MASTQPVLTLALLLAVAVDVPVPDVAVAPADCPMLTVDVWLANTVVVRYGVAASVAIAAIAATIRRVVFAFIM